MFTPSGEPRRDAIARSPPASPLLHKIHLTKDNLAKRNWHGCTKCCFCDSDETVEHLFISCPFARIVCRMVYFTYNIPPPTNITNMFSNWLNGVDKTDKARIHIGVSALCWSIWTCRNNFVFNKYVDTNFLQVIRMAAHWIQLWSCFSRRISGSLWLLGATGC
jgi:hypothetical protein